MLLKEKQRKQISETNNQNSNLMVKAQQLALANEGMMERLPKSPINSEQVKEFIQHNLEESKYSKFLLSRDGFNFDRDIFIRDGTTFVKKRVKRRFARFVCVLV